MNKGRFEPFLSRSRWSEETLVREAEQDLVFASCETGPANLIALAAGV
jgi:hypothetical protein